MKNKVKYPFIADKNLYAAVMFACNILKGGNYRNFTDACKKAARYYGADLDEVITEVRRRRAVSATLHAKRSGSGNNEK